MNKGQLYDFLDLPFPEKINDPNYIVVGRFIPASIPELLDHFVTTARARTGSSEPYTFAEYRRLNLNGTLIQPPTLSDIDMESTNDPVLSETPISSPIYKLRRAFLYRQACADFNVIRNDEKKLLKYSWAKIGNTAANFRDYMGYLTAKFPQPLEPFFRPWRLPILEEDRERHTIVTGKSGYGKSTLLKAIMYNYMRQNGLKGIILFDPHGDLAEEMARLRENLQSDRLVYFDPMLHTEYTPVINPFDLPDRSPEIVEIAKNELIAVFRSVLSQHGTSFTSQMENILKPCIATLMIRPNSSLLDLMDFLDDKLNRPLIQYALKVLKNPVDIDFFLSDFVSDSYAPSKLSIRTRLRTLLGSHMFVKCLTGKSTINLKHEMDRGAFIVFNLSSGNLSSETSEAMGRFYIGLIQSIAQQRARIPENERKPVHMFIDECELFISEKVEKIMKESRKYKLYLTLAQQVFGHNMSDQLKQAILGNTAVKITGANALRTLKLFNAETGAELDELQNLKKGEFHLKSGEKLSVKMRVPFFLSEKKHIMNHEEWEQTKKEQLARYYRKNDSAGMEQTHKREVPIIDYD